MRKYIDVDALGIGKANRDVFNVPEYADGWNAAISLIMDEPEANVQPIVHAYRVKDYGVCELDFSRYETYRCSNCKGEVDDDDDYCSHCGAKMDEVEE